MSPTTETGLKLEQQADVAATGMLSAQLALMQVFLPMDYWVVVRPGKNEPYAVATFGKIGTTTANKLASLATASQWSHSHLDPFEQRPIAQMELVQLGLFGILEPWPVCVFKAAIPGPDDLTSSIIMGFMSQEGLPTVDVAAHGREIMLCLAAIEQTLTLHVELAATEKLVLDIKHEAQIDPLTKVLNRAGWNQRVRGLVNDEREVAIGFLDVDFLKFVNDSRGHLAGDQLLRLTAQTIKSVLRSDDCVARFGGDEFAVMLHDLSAVAVYELKGRLKLALEELGIGVSIGVALKSEAGSLPKALHLADIRMYEEKRTKKRPEIDTSSILDFK